MTDSFPVHEDKRRTGAILGGDAEHFGCAPDKDVIRAGRALQAMEEADRRRALELLDALARSSREGTHVYLVG